MKGKSPERKLQLIAIKTKNTVLISDNIDGSRYHRSYLKDYLYDGNKPEDTYKEDWVKLNKLPEKIETKVPPKQINRRYELKEGFSATDLTPKVINERYIDDESEYYEVKGLYDLKYDMTETTYDEIEFDINVIEELDEGFEITEQKFNYQYNLLDRIQTHPLLLQNKPCQLSKKETYSIIRNHVKNNINPKVAQITSDYDFCFTVKKKIELSEVQEYMVDVNSMHKRRKPKFEKRYNSARSVEVFAAAPEPYNSYPVVEPFVGENNEDLNNKVEAYLVELMDMINEPLVDCPNCKGKGVILDENKLG